MLQCTVVFCKKAALKIFRKIQQKTSAMKYFYSNIRDLKSSLRNRFHHMHSLPLNFTNNFRIPILLKTFFGKRLLRIHLNQYTIVSKRSCYQAKILHDVFAIRLPKMSSRRVCKTSCNYVFKTSWKTKNVILNTS